MQDEIVAAAKAQFAGQATCLVTVTATFNGPAIKIITRHMPLKLSMMDMWPSGVLCTYVAT